jgi:hypothetical protein
VAADENLLGRLKRRRMELARDRRVPACHLFDRSLIDMAESGRAPSNNSPPSGRPLKLPNSHTFLEVLAADANGRVLRPD